MKKVVVTGGSGKLGWRVIQDLVEHGYKVVSVDQRPLPEPLVHNVPADLNNLGEVYGVLKDADAVIHLAAIPAPQLHTNEVVFRNNVMSTFNILEASAALGIKKLVLGSSESIYGICYSSEGAGPLYVPMDEEHPLQITDGYGLSKLTNEQTAEMYHKRTGMQVVSLRFGYIMVHEDYHKISKFLDDPALYKRNVWSYIDIRDAVSACRLAMEADGVGAQALNISAADAFTERESADLMKQYYPQITDFREPIEGTRSLYNTTKAERLINWQPRHSWREVLTR